MGWIALGGNGMRLGMIKCSIQNCSKFPGLDSSLSLTPV